jgi:hypothetical protein
MRKAKGTAPYQSACVFSGWRANICKPKKVCASFCIQETAMTRIMALTIRTISLTLILVSLGVAQATSPSESELNARFSKILGTDAGKVVQHYYLVKNGGVIEFTAKDPNDSASVNAIRKYLDVQKDLFEKGKNDTDTDVHGKVPDGLLVMKKLRGEITFYTVNSEGGAVLRMFSVNNQARQAIHDFMKFQIAEHKTGDSPTTDQ